MKFKISQSHSILISITLVVILIVSAIIFSERQIMVISESDEFKITDKDFVLHLSINKYDEQLASYTSDGDIHYKTLAEMMKVRREIGIFDRKVFGIVLNPPKKQITDVKEIIKAYISSGQKVLLIYVDGLGYNQYIRYMEKGCIPAISTMGKAEKALTVYPPITDVAYTSMVTGKTPKYTGIHNRTDSDLMVETVFEELEKQGLKYSLIEGSSNIVNADLKVKLNIDNNKDGNIDDDIMNCAMEDIGNEADLMFVHFHSYDDMGHSYGPLSEEAQEQIELLDEYIKTLTENWKGTVILTSDHGMHTTEDGGNHGSFCAEDIYIPLLIYER